MLLTVPGSGAFVGRNVCHCAEVAMGCKPERIWCGLLLACATCRTRNHIIAIRNSHTPGACNTQRPHPRTTTHRAWVLFLAGCADAPTGRRTPKAGGHNRRLKTGRNAPQGTGARPCCTPRGSWNATRPWRPQ
eukprot:15071517-Alexandrium_andersonii.AAC.1